MLDRPTAMRVVLIWGGTRLLVLLAAAVAAWGALRADPSVAAYAEQWLRWDGTWYASIADQGYLIPDFSVKPDALTDFTWNGAFFPAVPILMWAGGLVGLSAAVVGLLVSLAASLVAALALARLALDAGAHPGWTTFAWLAAPTAVFLAAPYTEALFCAFAFWAWVFARRQRWLVAGLLASGAALCRSNGIFLGIALTVLFLVTTPRRWSQAWALLLPFAATVAFFGYLAVHTGRLTAWFDIQRLAWSREFTAPWQALANTVNLVFTYTPDGSLSSRFITEIIAMALLAVFTVLVLLRRWWGEGAFMLVTLISLGTSTWYYSIPRAAVVLFPIWVLLGLWMSRSRTFRATYAVISLPFLALVVARFVQAQWIS